jgi:RNA polymerase-binding transcription factor DksA
VPDVPSPDATHAIDATDVIDAIARDLDDVDAALKRLDAGTYFTDEATGAPLDPAWLAQRPLARRAPQPG